jgi:hypothetical protein
VIGLKGTLVPSAALAGPNEDTETITALLEATDKFPCRAGAHTRSSGKDERSWRVGGMLMSMGSGNGAELGGRETNGA